MEKAAKYIKEHKRQNGENTPFILGGDFNSLPISSGLSAFYGEDIEVDDSRAPSQWNLPQDLPAA